MSPTEQILQLFRDFLPLLATLAIVVFALVVANRILQRRRLHSPNATFHLQLAIVALGIAGVLAIIVVLPVDDSLRGDLLGVIGILLSAAIALSSTTFIGNMMAGIMLRTVKSARPGDFITVADVTGRITEMDLLHTEIQTEFRDLVTVPNLYLVTQPLKVVRASGTIIAADVTLGYDVHRERIVELLSAAAGQAGLEDGFVHVRELGDFSVSYRVAGLLKDVESLISARSRLREAMLDSLHEGGVEIVSPTFMNTRAVGDGPLFIPEAAPTAAPAPQPNAED
ncbi:MAG: mechanosensitive ion channel, partial [Gemmatimonadetes bacterium]|nr:mechanosensitive ion channel [Gemmatimonadota bacterium]